MLLHVLSASEKGYPDLPFLSSMDYYPGRNDVIVKTYLEQLEAFKAEGLERLRSLTEMATKAGVSTEFTQTPGVPGDTICDLARTWNADLIIMGRRGRAGITELLMGSVSNYVTHHAYCSVLTVHQMEKLEESTPEKEGTIPISSP